MSTDPSSTEAAAAEPPPARAGLRLRSGRVEAVDPVAGAGAVAGAVAGPAVSGQPLADEPSGARPGVPEGIEAVSTGTASALADAASGGSGARDGVADPPLRHAFAAAGQAAAAVFAGIGGTGGIGGAAEAGRGTAQPAGAGASPPPPPHAEPRPAEPPRRVAARFSSASSALVFTAQLGRVGAADVAQYRQPDTAAPGHWWVRGFGRLAQIRELSATTRGVLHVEVEGWLVPDPGWGPAPSGGIALGPAERESGLRAAGAVPCPPEDQRVSQAEVLHAAGLREVPATDLREVSILAPGDRIAALVRRCLDLGLTAEYRAVDLAPLTAAETPGHEPTEAEPVADVRIELVVRAARTGFIPPSQLNRWARDPDRRLLLCRRAAPNLLIQYRQACPLEDRLVAALAGPRTWVLAAQPYGCASLHPQGPAVDAAELVRRDPERPLVPARTSATAQHGRADATPTTIPIRVVRSATPGATLDAVLLAEDDLPALAVVLEGHPLAEAAVLAPGGGTRRLLLASGGLLERIPLGVPLYCVGPGQLYLALGTRLSPRLPPTARLRLFEPDEDTAVVLTDESTHEFDLRELQPVWRLWAGSPPPVETRLPRRTAQRLRALDTDRPPAAEQIAQPAGRPWPWQRSNTVRRAGRTWREAALDAELAGELAAAAELHLQNAESRTDHLRAAQLLERAAKEQAEEKP